LVEIHEKRGTNQFTDSDLPLTIGSAAGAHVLLQNGKAVEGYIGESNGYLFIQPADGSSDFYHNDQHIESSTWIKSGDSTRIDSALLNFVISGDLVEIHVSSVEDQEMLTPPGTPHPDMVSAGEPLPRTSDDIRAKRSGARKAGLLASGFFLLLLIAAVFVLTARSLEVVVNPAPDTLSISGFPPVVKLGSHFLGLTGEYSVKATKAGYQQLDESVTISDNDANRFTFTLDKLPGRIDFFTTPLEGSQIYVDGQHIGVTPLSEVQLAAGEHRVRIERHRYLVQEFMVMVEGLDIKQRVDVTLEPAWSEVTLIAEPAGTTVIIDKQELGQTPLTLELLAGSHTIIFQKKDFSPHIMKLDVAAGARLTPEAVVLKPAPAFIELQSKPSGTTVTVDSIYKGRTPLKVEISSKKEHTIVLSRPGYKDLTKKIKLGPGEKRTMAVDLQPEYGVIFLTAEPPEAELYIDGKSHGKATGRLELTVREHTLEVRAKGYQSKTLAVTPQKNYSRQVDVSLIPEGQEAQKGSPLQDRKRTRIGHELILLGPASFQMGASKGEQGRRSNERQHKVQINRLFYLGAKEVTNAEFRLYKPGHLSGAFARHSLDKDMQPVVNISWDDAARFMNWLSEQDGLESFYKEEDGKMVPVKPFTTGYRLPFEAEWAYAARIAGRKEAARFDWQGSFPPRDKSGNFADETARSLLPVIIKGYNDTFAAAAPVASFNKNPAGFFDMGSNVSEWCHDYYAPYTGLASEIRIDPTGPESGTHHVVRGASWRDGSITEVRLSYRGYSRENRDDIGFRIARYAR
jgi:formylglycine-generating enzyme required for sulfatase activity